MSRTLGLLTASLLLYLGTAVGGDLDASSPPEAAATGVVFAEDFELDPVDWLIDDGEWQIGTPTAGPGACHGGERCAGTVLDGNYSVAGDSRLIGPDLLLPADLAADERLELRFWQWYAYSYRGTDQGTVEIAVWDGTAWGDWQPLATPAPAIHHGTAWSRVALDLSAYAGQTVRIAFRHHAWDTYTYGDEDAGWFIDDVKLWRGIPDSAATDFESGQGDWSTGTGLWALGTPSYGLSACFSGATCFDTVLDGNYPANSTSRLMSPPIALPGVAGDEALILRFRHWFSYSSRGVDRGAVEVRRWRNNAWTDWRPIYAGAPEATQSNGWQLAAVDLSDFAGELIQIGFRHYARDNYTYGDEAPGWFIDNVNLSHYTPASLPIGESASGSLDDSGDREYYALELPPEGHLQIQLNILDDLGS